MRSIRTGRFTMNIRIAPDTRDVNKSIAYGKIYGGSRSAVKEKKEYEEII